MAKTISLPFRWKRFATNALDTYTGLPGEPVVDMRSGKPELRICDGVTPGGHPLSASSGGTSGIATPSIVSPVDGATGVSSAPIITADAFVGVADGAVDSHAASFWEVASDAGFGAIEYRSGRDTAALTSIDLQAKGVSLVPGLKYARVRYEGASGAMSNWSAVVSFDVIAIGIGTVIDGDIVFGQKDGYWLLAAPATKRELRAWGLQDIDTTLTNITSPATPDGVSGEINTGILVSPTYANVTDSYGRVGSPAANFCHSELDKAYFLPNKDELDLLYQNRAAVDGADTSGGVATLAAIGADTSQANGYGRIWSSTEYEGRFSWYLRLSDGQRNYSSKMYIFWTAPIRRISV